MGSEFSMGGQRAFSGTWRAGNPCACDRGASRSRSHSIIGGTFGARRRQVSPIAQTCTPDGPPEQSSQNLPPASIFCRCWGPGDLLIGDGVRT